MCLCFISRQWLWVYTSICVCNVFNKFFFNFIHLSMFFFYRRLCNRNKRNGLSSIVQRSVTTGIRLINFISNECKRKMLGWVINKFRNLKAKCKYAFQTLNVLNATRNFLIKECLNQSSLFQLWKRLHHNLINDFTSLKWMNWKYIFDMQCCETLRITKTLQKQLRKFLVFMVKVSLRTTKSETSFQNFILVIRHWEKNPPKGTHQTSIKML